IFLMGGRCTRSDEHQLAWTGPGNLLRDLWFYNEGNHWQLLTVILDGESDDCGAGYRMKASMAVFKDELYLLGGVRWAEGLIAGEPLRDCLRLNFHTGMPFPRFTVLNGDLMAAWPNEDKKKDYFIAGASVWRNRLIALMSKGGGQSQDFMLWASDDGIGWEPMHKGKYVIYSSAAGYYIIAGDHVNDVQAGDTLTALGESNFFEHAVTEVLAFGQNTKIVVDDGLGDVVPSGTIYVHAVALNPIVTEEIFSRSCGFENFKESLYLLGGIDSYPRAGKILIHKVENSIAHPKTVALREIVEELCAADAGIDPDLIDASQLTDDVDGVCAANRPTVKEMIEMLRQYGFFDAVDSDGVLKFVKRGGNPAFTVSDGDLAAEDPGKSKKPEKLTITYEQENDLPRSVEVVYADSGQDYLDGAQTAKRSVSGAQKPVTLNMTIAMNANRAARTAEINLWEYWASRAILNWQTKYDFLHLDPADVGTLQVLGSEHITRIKSMDFGAPRVIKFQSVLEEPHIYTDEFLDVAGVVKDVRRNNMIVDYAVSGYLMDIPILSMQDDDFGFYFAARPADPEHADRWRGADLHVKDPESGAWAVIVTAKAAANAGIVSTPAGGARTAVWDNVNAIEVHLWSGSLSSCSEEDALSGANRVLYGDEILQFCEAEQVSENVWRCSKLLRGRYCTERHVDGHAENERFVMLDDAVIRIKSEDRNVLGKELSFCLTVLRGAPSDAAAAPFTCNGTGKKPASPVYLEAQRREDGCWRISWMRRTRGAASWEGGFPLPLNEESEKYEIDFLYEGEVSHTQEIKILSYPSQRKIQFDLPVEGFDFINGLGETEHQYGQDEVYGAAADSIHVKVYQISEAVGRGFEAEGQFSV
ncbi:MAG: phage tail protein, partial [Candidatus Omnitrophica bacterium]|nr:phage tail protein [Candidatus Omnitrophota bacterium]